jgi:hypothetical protein
VAWPTLRDVECDAQALGFEGLGHAVEYIRVMASGETPFQENARLVTAWILGGLLVVGAAGLVALALQPEIQPVPPRPQRWPDGFR